MESMLNHLLELFDVAYPNNLSVNELEGHGFKRDFIMECMHKNLLDYPHNMQDYGIEEINKKDNLPLVLGKQGFLMLIQFRLKKATEKLDDSVKKFDESSEKSSKNMITLTVWIKGLTIALVLIGIIQTGLILKQIGVI